MPSHLKSIITRRSAGSASVAEHDPVDATDEAEPPVSPALSIGEETNSVSLSGLLTEPGQERELAGGVHVVRWTLRVARGAGRSGSDLIDCVALDPVLQGRALSWAAGSELAVDGALRRRFFRSGGRTATRVEVEVVTAIEVAGPPDTGHE
jgi:single-strand DNA-binding protein